MMAASSQSSWEISMYEAHRKPHELIIDDSLIAVSPRALHAELMCPICLDLMRNTQTTKECLHRFCQECIITALRSGNKECPTCRKKLVSKRSLRPDPNFDALIAKIYPNREELSNQQEKHHPTRATPLVNSAIQKRKRKSDISVTGSNETPPSSRASTPLNAVGDKRVKLGANNDSLDDLSDSEGSVRQATLMPTIEFQLRPHPDDADLSNYIIRNLCSTPDTTVAHLIKFLQLIEKEDASFSSSELCLSIDEDQSKNYVNLSRSISLKQICDQYWTGEKLKLFFSLPGSVQN